MKQEGKARLVQAEGDYRRSNQCPANWSRTQSPSDPKPYSEVTKTWKDKELFDPNLLHLLEIFLPKFYRFERCWG
jgi:hypothetical protein